MHTKQQQAHTFSLYGSGGGVLRMGHFVCGLCAPMDNDCNLWVSSLRVMEGMWMLSSEFSLSKSSVLTYADTVGSPALSSSVSLPFSTPSILLWCGDAVSSTIAVQGGKKASGSGAFHVNLTLSEWQTHYLGLGIKLHVTSVQCLWHRPPWQPTIGLTVKV